MRPIHNLSGAGEEARGGEGQSGRGRQPRVRARGGARGSAARGVASAGASAGAAQVTSRLSEWPRPIPCDALRAHDGPALHLVFSRDGHDLWTAGRDGQVVGWRLRGEVGAGEGAVSWTRRMAAGLSHDEEWVAWQVRGVARRWVARQVEMTGLLKYHIVIYIIAHHEYHESHHPSCPFPQKARRKPIAPHLLVTHMELTADGRHLVLTLSDYTVRVIDSETGAQRHAMRGHEHSVQVLQLHPTGEGVGVGVCMGVCVEVCKCCSSTRQVRVWVCVLVCGCVR